MELKDYTTEELERELKKRDITLKFTDYIQKQAKAYDINLPHRGYDLYAFAKDLLAWLEKQGEQKSTDKIEPKFKVGDWIVNEFGDWTVHIDSLDKKSYRVSDGKGNCNYFPISKQDEMHLWTIEDAKDGDVLFYNEEILLFKSYSVQCRFSIYCWYDGHTNNFYSKEVVDTALNKRNKIYPATKEQRDLLFTKMKEAGYEWDFNKKELIKIEDEPENFKQQVMSEMTDLVKKYIRMIDWSEKDEHKIKDIVYFLETAKKHYASTVEIDAYIKWLESLKKRIRE